MPASHPPRTGSQRVAIERQAVDAPGRGGRHDHRVPDGVVRGEPADRTDLAWARGRRVARVVPGVAAARRFLSDGDRIVPQRLDVEHALAIDEEETAAAL